jgi:AcrR family transcriptional regulator
VTPDHQNRRVRRPLTRERVLQAGVDFADAYGLRSLTMRKLGEALGVEGMALYKHVANKDSLLDGMLDLILSEAEPPEPGGDWKAELRRGAVSTFNTLLRHPWACQLHLASGGSSGPARLRQMNAILGTLREGGFSVEMTHHAYHVLDIYVYGFALGTVSFPVNKEDLLPMASAFMQELPSDEYAYLIEHITYHIETDVLSEGDFEFGLDLMLDSLERLRGLPTAGAG